MLDNMPDPCDLHLERSGGRCAMMAGSAVLSEYAESDVVMRNFAITTARRAGFEGTRVAEVFGLSGSYVSTLHAAALRDGSAALVKQPGPGRPLSWAGRRWTGRGSGGRTGSATGRSGVGWGWPALRSAGGWGCGAPGPPRRTDRRRAGRRAASRWSARRKPPGTFPAAGLSLLLASCLSRRPPQPALSRARGPPGDPPAPAPAVPPGDGNGVPGSGGGEGGGVVPGPAGRWRRAGSGPGMRGRCCCTRSGPGPAPRTC